jgi:hypothetical protein
MFAVVGDARATPVDVQSLERLDQLISRAGHWAHGALLAVAVSPTTAIARTLASVCTRVLEIKHDEDEKVSSVGKLQALTASDAVSACSRTFRTQASDRHSQVKSLHKQQTPRDGSLSIVLRKPAVEDGT